MKMIKVKRSKVKAKIEAVELKKKKLEDELKKWENQKEETKLKWGYNPESSFNCGMCRKEYNEGFDDVDKLKRFLMAAGSKWKELSLYHIEHGFTSSCYKNTICELCEASGKQYDRFVFRTQRDRHFKKFHSKQLRECPTAS